MANNDQKDLESARLVLQLAEQTILNCNNQLAYWRIQTGILHTKIRELEEKLKLSINE